MSHTDSAGRYRNQDPSYHGPDRLKLLAFLWRKLSSIFSKSPDVVADPPASAPFVPSADGNYAVWVGHSTVLVRQGGVTFLTDPMFSDRASPFRSIGPLRHRPPAIAIHDLPPLRFVLVSHNHYDHLDRASVLRLHEMFRPLFVVPEGLARWFRAEGIENVTELGWWQTHDIDQLRITAVPARHFSKRSLWDLNRSHWCGFTVAGAQTFYYSGDTGYCGVFKEISEKIGSVDLAVLPIGAYEPREVMKAHHLDPEEALAAFEECRGKRLLAVHWGTFNLTEEPFDEPPRRMNVAAERRGCPDGAIVASPPGELVRW